MCLALFPQFFSFSSVQRTLSVVLSLYLRSGGWQVMPELWSRYGCCCQHLSRGCWLLFVAFHTEQILINQMLKVETRAWKCLENHHGEIWFSLPATLPLTTFLSLSVVYAPWGLWGRVWPKRVDLEMQTRPWLSRPSLPAGRQYPAAKQNEIRVLRPMWGHRASRIWETVGSWRWVGFIQVQGV